MKLERDLSQETQATEDKDRKKESETERRGLPVAEAEQESDVRSPYRESFL